MTLPTVQVRIQCRTPQGEAVPGARVRCKLTHAEVDGALVVPLLIEGTADAQGDCTLALWPNERSTQGSQYQVSIATAGEAGGNLLYVGHISVPASLPQHQPVPFELLVGRMPYPRVPANELALARLQAAEVAIAGAQGSSEQSAVDALANKIAAEGARDTAQGHRSAAETARTAAEGARDTAQEHRTAAETARTAAEGARDTAQGHRTAAETARTAAEGARDTAQGHRSAAETARTAAEGARDTAQGHRTAAATSETNAGQSASAAAISAGSASTSAGAASQDRVLSQAGATQAQSSASVALAAAASASSVLQQDLSMVNVAALHRSPNAILALHIYNTALDSDSGAWPKRCQHTSWYNEPLNGAWRGAIGGANLAAAETTARAISGIATADYFQYSGDGRFYRLNAGSGTTEVFRGNKADFPALAAIVADSSSLTIYDLTEANRPMWMRFDRPTAAQATSLWAWNNVTPSSIACREGWVYYASWNGSRLKAINFISEIGESWGSGAGSHLRALAPIALRNSAWAGAQVDTQVIASNELRGLAVTIRPDAPIEAATGLRVPTVAVASDGGINVIRHDGVITNPYGSALASQATSFGSRGGVIFHLGENGKNYRVSLPPYTTFTQYGVSPATPSGSFSPLSNSSLNRSNNKRQTALLANNTANVFLMRDNGSGPNSSAAHIANTFNTGHMHGDIRRAYITATATGSISGSNLVLNGGFDADLGSWTLSNTATASLPVWSAGAMRLVSDGSGFSNADQSVVTVAGMTYVLALNLTHPGAGSLEIRFGTTQGGAELGGSPTITSGGLLLYRFTATGATSWIRLRTGSNNATGYVVDNVSVRGAVFDRSYRESAAAVTGSLTRSAVASGAQLSAVSGFSAANFVREPYSAALDFGTGAWYASGWMNTLPAAHSLLANPERFDQTSTWIQSNASIPASFFTAPTGSNTAQKLVEDTSFGVEHRVFASVFVTAGVYTISVHAKAGERSWFFLRIPDATPANRYAWFNLTSGVVGTVQSGLTASISSLGDGWYRCSASVTMGANTNIWMIGTAPSDGVSNYTGDGSSGVFIWGAQINRGAGATAYKPSEVNAYESTSWMLDRSAASGPHIRLGIDSFGRLLASASDGTTTRTATSTATYNSTTWVKAEATYIAGRLALIANGQEIAAAHGAPLLTLNSATADLTIGNGTDTACAFPGSLALVKLSASIPTAEQLAWMYAQELQLFRAGAQCCLPDTGAIQDLSYDEVTDRWTAVTAANESIWSGIVRAGVVAAPSGSYSRVAHGGGAKLTARTTTNPGVDVSIPAYALREELVKRAESAARLSRVEMVLDYVGGFTASTTSTSSALASVANLSLPLGATAVNAVVTGTGIPASTVVTGVSGTTVHLSAAATATGTGVQINFTDFVLPPGCEATAVMVGGTLRREGAAQDYTRLFDGFRETIRFAVAPGNTAWVQIQAVRVNA